MSASAKRFPYVAEYVTRIGGSKVRQRVRVVEKFRTNYRIVSDKPLRLPYRTTPTKQELVIVPPGVSTLVAACYLEPVARRRP